VLLPATVLTVYPERARIKIMTTDGVEIVKVVKKTSLLMMQVDRRTRAPVRVRERRGPYNARG
jgi:hypothetical protein